MDISDIIDDDLTPKGAGEDAIKRPNDGPAAGQVERALGFILDEQDEEKVAKHVVQHRKDQTSRMSRLRAVWKRNRWWREGKRWVKLEKKQDLNQWVAKLPYRMGSLPPLPNKTDRLCRRIGSTILVDKPFPECEPGDDSNEAKDAAEFATRYLSVKGAESELNFAELCRSAFDKACTYASSFAWVTMDPGGAGHRPRTMRAHPRATHRDNALEDPTAGEELGIPGLTLAARDEDLMQRYVRPDGSLSDAATDADLEWLPGPKVRLLTGLQLTFLPETARGMRDAIGIVITDLTTLGELRALFPERFARLDKDGLETICKWRPDHIEDLLPAHTKMPEDQKFEDGDREGEYKDSQPVVVSTAYYRRCAEYPYGCYAVVGGETLVLHKQKWTAMMPGPLGQDGKEGPMVEECLRIPVAQDRCLNDDTTDDPFGIGIAEHLGAADEIAASALGFQLEHMFRAANPHMFIPIGSSVQPDDVLVRNNMPIMVPANGKPVWEQVPELSGTIPALREEMQQDQNDAAGLQEAAQGVESSTVKSGVHAQTIVNEALKAVGPMKDNLGDFYVNLCEIVLEQARAFSTAPQLLSYTGEDGAYKEREWSRTDFSTTKRVAIARGSFTMHTLAAKQQIAQELFAAKAIDQDEYLERIAGGASPLIGVQENPHLLRVRRQIERFMEGPPPGWVEQVQTQQRAYQAQVAGATAMATSAGQPAPAAPPPPPLPPTPFSNRLPVDLEIIPAKIRHAQLSRKMVSSRFERLAPEWQQAFFAEYAEMRNASGLVPIPDVQRAQAEQEANRPPALPRGVSITMKADERTVAAEEREALAGFQRGAPPPAAVAQ
jgi:hypothetical protein